MQRLCVSTLLLLCLGSLPICAQLPGKASPDSALVSASDQYSRPNIFQRIFLGKNYREAWSVPVKLPVFNMQALGLTITELGGGMQTKSLRLIDADSVKWVLRTVDKDPSGIIPKAIRNTLTVSTVQQVISAAYPYAPVVVAPMAKQAGIVAADPGIYWVPDDAAFGPYRKLFAGKVCILERKNITTEDLHTSATAEILPAMLSDSRHKVDQRLYLRARLLDMLIADWDRHADQWIWGVRPSGSDTAYEALPKDRDQAFFYSKGLLVRLVAAVKLKHFVGFTYTTKNLRKLNHKSWNMDRLFLNQLTLQDWQAALQAFHDSLTDAVITSAVGRLPANAYAINGKTIRAKLISRRDGMLRDVPRYYRYLAGEVAVYGTDEPELYDVSGDASRVTVTIRTGGNRVTYQRTFDPKETRKIEIFALGGNDTLKCINGDRFGLSLMWDEGPGDFDTIAENSDNVRIGHTAMDAAQANLNLRKALRIKDEEK